MGAVERVHQWDLSDSSAGGGADVAKLSCRCSSVVAEAAVVVGAWVDEGGVTVVESLQPATMRPSVATRPRNRR